MTLVELLTTYMSSLQTILTPVPVILGNPVLGRPEVRLPIAALTFTDNDYARVTEALSKVRGLGRGQPAGQSIRATVYLYAENERKLLDLLDSFWSAKGNLTEMTVGDQKVRLVYEATNRLPFDEMMNEALRFAVATDLLFVWF